MSICHSAPCKALTEAKASCAAQVSMQQEVLAEVSKAMAYTSACVLRVALDIQDILCRAIVAWKSCAIVIHRILALCAVVEWKHVRGIGNRQVQRQ